MKAWVDIYKGELVGGRMIKHTILTTNSPLQMYFSTSEYG